jgi:hypothetical protein
VSAPDLAENITLLGHTDQLVYVTDYDAGLYVLQYEPDAP